MDNMKKEKETRIYNLIILDESGSMSGIREQALSGVNETIQTIRAAQQENPDDNQIISLVTFDNGSGNRPNVRTLIDKERIEKVKDLSPEQYSPYGGTPLYDAMGESITALKSHVHEGDHALVTIVTDGYENASRFYNGGQIKELVDSLSSQGWVFTYIGANQSSSEAAGALGIKYSMDFQATVEGSAMMFDKMRSSNREYYKRIRREKAGEAIDIEGDFFAEQQALTRVTPEHIGFLKEDEIFVFGSNEHGFHDGGAARAALERYGAIYGQGRGPQGQSYAIPTMGLSLSDIAGNVREFIMYADQHPEKTFLVTRIGCGTAGFRDEEIAPLFALAYSLPNVYLPGSFWKILSYHFGR